MNVQVLKEKLRTSFHRNPSVDEFLNEAIEIIEHHIAIDQIAYIKKDIPAPSMLNEIEAKKQDLQCALQIYTPHNYTTKDILGAAEEIHQWLIK